MNKTSIVLKFTPLDPNHSDHASVAHLILNRPQSANAFNETMISEITESLEWINEKKEIRLLTISNVGKHFSAGADLAWMKKSACLSHEENKQDAHKLGLMFKALFELKIPTIAITTGAVYGGAVGLVAACDYAVASTTTKFCLSEVKLGLIPAVIFPYLRQKISGVHLNRFALSAKVMNAEQAKDIGLVAETAEPEKIGDLVKLELTHLLNCGSQAQKALKHLKEDLENCTMELSRGKTEEAIAQIRIGEEAQEGLSCFFEKKQPSWQQKLPESWSWEKINNSD